MLRYEGVAYVDGEKLRKPRKLLLSDDDEKWAATVAATNDAVAKEQSALKDRKHRDRQKLVKELDSQVGLVKLRKEEEQVERLVDARRMKRSMELYAQDLALEREAEMQHALVAKKLAESSMEEEKAKKEMIRQQIFEGNRKDKEKARIAYETMLREKAAEKERRANKVRQQAAALEEGIKLSAELRQQRLEEEAERMQQIEEQRELLEAKKKVQAAEAWSKRCQKNYVHDKFVSSQRAKWSVGVDPLLVTQQNDDVTLTRLAREVEEKRKINKEKEEYEKHLLMSQREALEAQMLQKATRRQLAKDRVAAERAEALQRQAEYEREEQQRKAEMKARKTQLMQQKIEDVMSVQDRLRNPLTGKIK